jgi:lipoprotein NlpI
LFAGDAKGAVEAFREEIRLAPDRDRAHWRLGIALYFAGAFQEGAAQFAKYHTEDSTDRENGIWKFLCDHADAGMTAARERMLVYRVFDREPFPALYALYAGTKRTSEFKAHMEQPELRGNRRAQFFGDYYLGLLTEMEGDRVGAIETVERAVDRYTAETAWADRTGYMWAVARMHLEQLRKAPVQPR